MIVCCEMCWRKNCRKLICPRWKTTLKALGLGPAELSRAVTKAGAEAAQGCKSVREGPHLTSCLQSSQDCCLWEQIEVAVYVNLELLINNLEYLLLVNGNDHHLAANCICEPWTGNWFTVSCVWFTDICSSQASHYKKCKGYRMNWGFWLSTCSSAATWVLQLWFHLGAETKASKQIILFLHGDRRWTLRKTKPEWAPDLWRPRWSKISLFP